MLPREKLRALGELNCRPRVDLLWDERLSNKVFLVLTEELGVIMLTELILFRRYSELLVSELA